LNSEQYLTNEQKDQQVRLPPSPYQESVPTQILHRTQSPIIHQIKTHFQLKQFHIFSIDQDFHFAQVIETFKYQNRSRLKVWHSHATFLPNTGSLAVEKVKGRSVKLEV
jgi:hypothetical protein